jgi:hypothetical protein
MRIGAFLIALMLILLLLAGLTSAGIITLGGENFYPAKNATYANGIGEGGAYIESGAGVLVAPLNLPQGAMLTGFKAIFFNYTPMSDSSELEISLCRVILYKGGYQFLANVNSQGISNYGSKDAIQIYQSPIDNNNFSYSVRAYSNSWKGQNLKIMGVIITFELPPNIPSTPLGPTSGTSGTSYNYSTSTTAIDSDWIEYYFDWGDGTTSRTNFVRNNFASSGISANATHKWSNAGKYLVKARAINNVGAFSEWSSPLAVIIINPTPNTPATPLGPTSGVPGTSYSYSTSATDPISDRIKYTVDWGDGGISETGFVNSGTTVLTPHIWFNNGTYQVKAKATDTGGRFSGWSAPINVTISA